jgi:hypothetical protein
MLDLVQLEASFMVRSSTAMVESCIKIISPLSQNEP